MSTLTAALLVQLASACSGPGVSPARMVAHAQVESTFRTTAIHDNTSGKSFFPDDDAAAAKLAAMLVGAGHSVDAGVMQINSGNWAALGLTASSVFEPQANVCAGRAVLAEAWAAERRVSCRYNAGRPNCGYGYPEKIEAAMVRYEVPDAQPVAGRAVASVEKIPVPPKPPGDRPPSWDVYATAKARRGVQVAATGPHKQGE